jgi:hypothetical protein
MDITEVAERLLALNAIILVINVMLLVARNALSVLPLIIDNYKMVSAIAKMAFSMMAQIHNLVLLVIILAKLAQMII